MADDPSLLFQRSLYDPDDFTLTFELVPNRGGKGSAQARLLTLAREAAADGRLKALSITENAGGHPTLSPEVLGLEIRELGLDVINHFSCKDKNRNQMESLLYSWDRLGLHHLLVLTGDYPQHGFMGRPKPVFDLDSVQTLDMINRMNGGQTAAGSTRSEPLHPTSFLQGAAISPFKLLEAEQTMQYAKLHRKIAAGADYLITQLGYDARKFHELLLYLRHHQFDLPVLGNVFIPNLAVAEYMYRGEVPGCVIPHSLYDEFQREASSADRGKKARLTRGAKLLAVLKGLGYHGAHIGGPGLTFADLDFVMTRAQEFDAEWQQLLPEFAHWPAEGFHLYELDPATGLNRPAQREAAAQKFTADTANYRLAHLAHDLMFEAEGLLFPAMKTSCLALAAHHLDRPLLHIEHLLKFILFNCRNCGDCRLAELAFLCPQSGCAKYQLNGACGGSRDGWCEVYPGQRRCLFVRLHERLQGQTTPLSQGVQPPRDWTHNETSSWLNFYRNWEEKKKNPDK